MPNSTLHHPPRPRLHSFTLVELLVVMSIIAILAALSLTAFSSVLRSQSVSTGTQMLASALDLARQSAITRDSQVEFRLYQLPDYNAAPSSAPTAYRGYQTFLISGTATNALTKPTFLPNPVVIASSTQVSPLLANNTLIPGSSLPSLPSYGQNYNALPFRFSAAGGLVNPGTAQWYMTLIPENAPTSGSPALPSNYTIIQIDTFSGRAKTFRP